MSTVLLSSIFTLNISADTVAWYAAIIGTFSALKVVYDILSDRRKIRLNYRVDVTLQGRGYDPNETQFCLETINTGKRTVKIVNAGYFNYDGKKFILSDSLFNQQDRILTDASPSTDYFVPLKDVVVNKIWYIYALDATGKVHKKYVHKLGALNRIPVYFKRKKAKKNENKK